MFLFLCNICLRKYFSFAKIITDNAKLQKYFNFIFNEKKENFQYFNISNTFNITLYFKLK